MGGGDLRADPEPAQAVGHPVGSSCHRVWSPPQIRATASRSTRSASRASTAGPRAPGARPPGCSTTPLGSSFRHRPGRSRRPYRPAPPGRPLVSVSADGAEDGLEPGAAGASSLAVLGRAPAVRGDRAGTGTRHRPPREVFAALHQTLRRREGRHPRPGPVPRRRPGPRPVLLGASRRAAAPRSRTSTSGAPRRPRRRAARPRLPRMPGAARACCCSTPR